MRINYSSLKAAAKEYFNVERTRNGHGSILEYHRKWKSTFGLTPSDMVTIINNVDREVEAVDPRLIKYWLGMFHELRCYPTMDRMADILQCDKRTARTYIWRYVDHLARLDMVCDMYEIRYPDAFNGTTTNPTKITMARRMAALRASINELQMNMADEFQNLTPDHDSYPTQPLAVVHARPPFDADYSSSDESDDPNED